MLRIWRIHHNNTSYVCHHHHIRPVLLIPLCILLFFSSHASFRSPPSLTFTSNDCEEAFVHSQPSRCSYQNRQKIPKPVLNLTGRQWDTPWIHNQGTFFSPPILVQLDLAWSCKSIKHTYHYLWYRVRMYSRWKMSRTSSNGSLVRPPCLRTLLLGTGVVDFRSAVPASRPLRRCWVSHNVRARKCNWRLNMA